ncbi:MULTISPECIES: dihydrofolate reductase family protein [Nocardiaceae]|uniref:Dihydrofolate reductase n=1 Tax=Rhodococcoides corynebacterioides TaxID=53972 RepID=A0ABS2KNL8_9NOCA|nr:MULTISPECIES: dihydrofolate reductase family protein [Rhodococcus]MBM7413403.1 dihydrofolate reductase [Rhodococcus corynebacterioides]MBP1115866.1 dihydrofolate reductase [Rhodococcus sp. PvP016]
MGRLVVSVLTSLDGYFEGPDSDLGSLPFEDAFNDHNLTLLRDATAVVYGSTWFENNWRSWSSVAADPSSTTRDREIAHLVTTLDSVVVSDSWTVDPDAPWAATSRVVSRSDAPDVVRQLKERDDGDLVMFGSATTWNPFLPLGLVDELVVLIGAGLVGEGTKVYTGDAVALSLTSARVIPDSQLVELRYRPDDR